MYSFMRERITRVRKPGKNKEEEFTMNGKNLIFGLDRRVAISTLWIVVMINMAFADILGFITPGVLKEMMAMDTSQPFILIFAFLIEIPIAMIFISRILKPKANRIANLAAGIITILFVVGGGSAYLHYIFIASVEVLCMIVIMAMAWRLPETETGEKTGETA